MKNFLKLSFILAVLFISSNSSAQYLPHSYESIFNEMVENFKTIRGGNTITDGKTSLRLLAQDKIVLKIDHKKSVKTLTFVKAKDEEGNDYWVSGNDLTTDMVNKYEDDLTKILEKMLETSRKEAKI